MAAFTLLGDSLKHNTHYAFSIMGVFFVISIFFGNSSFASEQSSNDSSFTTSSIQDLCLNGPPVQISTTAIKETPYFKHEDSEGQSATLNPKLISWMNERFWQTGYRRWQDSQTNSCQTPENGYEFLLMHHHLINTFKTTWPDYENHLSAWEKFPMNDEDYPDFLQDTFYAWPDSVLKSVKLISRIPKMSQEELLSHWRNESEFGQWIQCGFDRKTKRLTPGMNLDSIYGALQFNAIGTSNNHNINNRDQQLDNYHFWKMHGWINKVWMMYRMKLNQKLVDVDFQADLLNQCQVHYTLAEQAKPQTKQSQKPNQELIFIDGQLNPSYPKAIRLIGKVLEIKTTQTGKQFFKLDLKLKGVQPIWATGYTQISESSVKLGEKLVFIGYIQAHNSQKTSKQQTPSMNFLLAYSIQSPK